MGTHGKVDLLIPSPVQAAGVTKPTVLDASSLAASFVAGAKLPAVPLAMSAPERPDAISIRVSLCGGARVPRGAGEEGGVHSDIVILEAGQYSLDGQQDCPHLSRGEPAAHLVRVRVRVGDRVGIGLGVHFRARANTNPTRGAASRAPPHPRPCRAPRW